MTAPAKVRRTYSLGAVLPHVRRAADVVGNLFDVETILGWRASAIDTAGHPAGLALDFMVYSDSAKGDRVAEYLLANAGPLGVKYVIWRQRYREPGGAWEPMEDRGSPTANHMDHPHATFKATGGDGTAVSADFAGVTATGTADGGTFDGWAGGLAGVALKLAMTGAALALVVNGVRKTVQN